MAGRGRAFQRNPELQRFILPDVRPTGRELGVGSYGSVEELEMNGLLCAGKRLHDALLQRDNAGVANIERKYLEECQVMPTSSPFFFLCQAKLSRSDLDSFPNKKKYIAQITVTCHNLA